MVLTTLAIKSFLTLLVVMDPVGLVPVFLALASDRDVAAQRIVAQRAVSVAGGLLVAFALGGAWLLQRLAISVDAFRVAGGVLLFRIAVDMVFAKHTRETKEEEEEAKERSDISVFPLAIPLIAGPGTLASVMILAGEGRAAPLGIVIVLSAALIVLVLSYVALRMAAPIGRLLGQTGVNVVTRVLGVLLAALAVQYVADGARGLLAPAASVLS